MGPDPFSGTPETGFRWNHPRDGGDLYLPVGWGTTHFWGRLPYHRGGSCRNHDAGNGPGAAGFEIILHHPHPRFRGIRGNFCAFPFHGSDARLRLRAFDEPLIS